MYLRDFFFYLWQQSDSFQTLFHLNWLGEKRKSNSTNLPTITWNSGAIALNSSQEQKNKRNTHFHSDKWKKWITLTTVFNLSCSAACWLFHLKSVLLKFFFSSIAPWASGFLKAEEEKKSSWKQNVWPKLTWLDNLSWRECVFVFVFVFARCVCVCMCVASHYDTSVSQALPGSLSIFISS